MIVEAAVAMPEWRASRFRPTVVLFEGERFAVRAHHHESRGPHRYELELWPDEGVEPPGAVVEYDADFVRRRGQRQSVERASGVLSLATVPITPLLGFLPSAWKTRLERRFGLHAVAATNASITLEKIAATLCGVLSVIHLSTGGLSTGELVHALWLTPLLVLDGVMRLDAMMKAETPPPGFLEWLIPTRFRRSLAKERSEIYRTR